MRVVVGLTGGIACGKSTVAKQLRGLGAWHMDVDAVGRQVVRPGSPSLDAIARAFGAAMVGQDGALDRPRLAAVVFGDPDQRHKLEAIVHPAMRQQIGADLAAFRADPQATVAVIDAAILFEMGLDALCDETLAIVAAPSVQIARLRAERNLSEQQALQRLAAQLDQAEWLAKADHSIDNSGTPGELATGVDKWWQGLCQRHAVVPPAGPSL